MNQFGHPPICKHCQSSLDAGEFSYTNCKPAEQPTARIVDVAELLAAEQPLEVPAPEEVIALGTFECPRCGSPKPHRHDHEMTYVIEFSPLARALAIRWGITDEELIQQALDEIVRRNR